MKKDKSLAIVLPLCVLVVASAAFMARAYGDGPSKADYAALAQIKVNQKVLAKTRDAYQKFVTAKASNETQVQVIVKDGWNVDWKTMNLIPLQKGF